MSASWIVCQIGAREHYAIARSLQRRGVLDRLLTDTWIRPGNPLGHLKKGLRERFHPELASANVWAANLSSSAFEIKMRLRRIGGLQRDMARNDCFQRLAVRQLKNNSLSAKRIAIFAYSYAALDIFKLARSRGWRTVLGQIDPGPAEERIVTHLYDASSGQRGQWSPAPPLYWKRWREECQLADQIVVNSVWSRSGLEEEGIEPSKIRVVPLAYEGSGGEAGFKREYPARFTAERPLRALFLGQINLRKGVQPLLEAAELLQRENLEFWLVGPIQISIPPSIARAKNIKWFGPVARSETEHYYREADIFIFPTYSDGFGLTQVEAQAWQLPIIASRFCGKVVSPDVNGILLEELSPEAIANALRSILIAPKRLEAMASERPAEKDFTLENIAMSLLDDLQPARS